MNSLASRFGLPLLALAGTTLLSLGAAHAQVTVTTVELDVDDNTTLNAVMYRPNGFANAAANSTRAVVMLHGCSGIWSNRVVGATNDNAAQTPNLQNHIEKWGLRLAAQGVVALAVDSYTARFPSHLPVEDQPTSAQWQNQCAGTAWGGQVDPYTTRVVDARAAHAFLDAEFAQINANRIGLLGWSQGAQTAMVEIADTPRFDSTTLRDDVLFRTTVVFYPGCGEDLGFDAPDASFWHPADDFRMNMGEEDDFYGNCDLRMVEAVEINQEIEAGAPLIAYDHYDGADHSFDGVSQTWPTTTSCTNVSDDICAMRDADIDSLAFFLTNL